LFAFALEEQPTTDTIEELEIKFILQLSELARQRRLRDMLLKAALETVPRSTSKAGSVQMPIASSAG